MLQAESFLSGSPYIQSTMTKGPLGRELHFFDDNKNVIVVVGIDGSEPPTDILVSMREVINSMVIEMLSERENADLDPAMDITAISYEMIEQQEPMFGNAQYKVQFDINTGLEEINTEFVLDIENSVASKLTDLGFNVEGSRSKVV